GRQVPAWGRTTPGAGRAGRRRAGPRVSARSAGPSHWVPARTAHRPTEDDEPQSHREDSDRRAGVRRRRKPRDPPYIGRGRVGRKTASDTPAGSTDLERSGRRRRRWWSIATTETACP